MAKIFLGIHFKLQWYTRRGIMDSLMSRGLISDVFPKTHSKVASDLLKNSKPQTIYAGFDATSNSLHAGNLLVLVALIQFLRKGHQVICLIGGATAAIGDPSGKSLERPVLLEEEIEKNSVSISSDINKIFSNHLKYFWKRDHVGHKIREPIILNNKTWYTNKNVIDFVSKVGRNMRLGEMLHRTTIRERMKHSEGLSLAEFMYQAFQSYDWLYLYDKYDCRFQIGGNDQHGNIQTGYELIKKLRCQMEPKTEGQGQQSMIDVYGLLLPLIVNEKGEKFGKSDGQAIWLSRSKLSPYEFYQFFLRIKDDQIGKYLKLFTFLTEAEIEQIMEKFLKSRASRFAHEKLASSLTLLVHGQEGLELARKASSILFGSNFSQMKEMTWNDIQEIFGANAITKAYLDPEGTTVLDVVMLTKNFDNITDAGGKIRSGSVTFNQQKVTDPSQLINTDFHIFPNDTTLVRIGKQKYFIIKWR